jgi:hypothetical protein
VGDGYSLMQNETFGVNLKKMVTSYGGSLYAFLCTFYKMYYIQMAQTHYKIINLTKIFMD